MARADYIGCAVCDGKGLYDGYWEIRDRDDIQVAVLCPPMRGNAYSEARAKGQGRARGG